MLDKCVFLIDKVVWYVLIYLLGFLMCCLFEFIFCIVCEMEFGDL